MWARSEGLGRLLGDAAGDVNGPLRLVRVRRALVHLLRAGKRGRGVSGCTAQGCTQTGGVSGKLMDGAAAKHWAQARRWRAARCKGKARRPPHARHTPTAHRCTPAPTHLEVVEQRAGDAALGQHALHALLQDALRQALQGARQGCRGEPCSSEWSGRGGRLASRRLRRDSQAGTPLATASAAGPHTAGAQGPPCPPDVQFTLCRAAAPALFTPSCSLVGGRGAPPSCRRRGGRWCGGSRTCQSPCGQSPPPSQRSQSPLRRGAGREGGAGGG